MSKARLEKAFQQVQDAGEKAFVPYIMAGDGGLGSLEEKITFLAEAGATAIELGIPFSDPVADGPTIQAAGIRALKQGTTLKGVLDYLKQIKEKITVPIVLMTYFNPILQMGLEKFSVSAKEANVSGVIIPDLPVEHVEMISPYLKEQEIAHIQLVTLTSTEERMKLIAEKTEGFLYAVTVNGITGERSKIHDELGKHLQKVKQYRHTPVLAGFGISTPQQVEEISAYCDGVIIGSKIINLWEEGRFEEIKALAGARLHQKSRLTS
jgi:tryptophan synthase alpha chain